MNGEKSCHMYSKQDDQYPSNPAKELHMQPKKAADESGRSAEEDEYASEPGDEEKRVDYDLSADLMGRVFSLQVREG